jgi:hypothetical protein
MRLRKVIKNRGHWAAWFFASEFDALWRTPKADGRDGPFRGRDPPVGASSTGDRLPLSDKHDGEAARVLKYLFSRASRTP